VTGPQDAQVRFPLVFRRFISVFARPEHPLALFLDDLQWLDAATLDLLEDLLTRTDVQHLLLIGAYRDNEVNPAHPLVRKVEAIRRAGGTVHEIRKLEERIFVIVNQLNRGVPLVTSDAERLQIAELNLIAARRARASTAYKSALVHLAAGEALLSEEHWERHYPQVPSGSLPGGVRVRDRGTFTAPTSVCQDCDRGRSGRQISLPSPARPMFVLPRTCFCPRPFT